MPYAQIITECTIQKAGRKSKGGNLSYADNFLRHYKGDAGAQRSTDSLFDRASLGDNIQRALLGRIRLIEIVHGSVTSLMGHQ